MNFTEMEKMLESLDDEKTKYCEFCHTPFRPKNRFQRICGSDDCKKALAEWHRERYKLNGKQKEYNNRKADKERERRRKQRAVKKKIIDYDAEIERLERQIEFEKTIKKYGIHYGKHQAEKTLAKVEPIKKTL